MTQIDEQQFAELRSARGRSKLDAVKIYKSLTGESLAASKKFVESMDLGERPNDEDQMDQVLDEMSKGNKLAAIKQYRAMSGATLIDSKLFIENLAEELQIELPEMKGCARSVLLFVVGGSGIAYSLLT